MKIRGGERKWALRRIASRYLGPEIARAPKRALQTPQREWLGGVLSPLVNDAVSILSDHHWFNADALRKEWRAYQDGAMDNSFFIWQWVNTAHLLSN
jgi:asparagine synthase (glutamine-hydrolysing)